MENKIILSFGLVLVTIFGMMKINSCHSDKLEEKHFIKIEVQRDSLINALLIEKQINEQLHKANADSAVVHAKRLQKSDSINKSYWRKKIGQIPKYTPEQRNSVYDSIFGVSY